VNYGPALLALFKVFASGILDQSVVVGVPGLKQSCWFFANSSVSGACASVEQPPDVAGCFRTDWAYANFVSIFRPSARRNHRYRYS
jgi:hypothetical protein